MSHVAYENRFLASAIANAARTEPASSARTTDARRDGDEAARASRRRIECDGLARGRGDARASRGGRHR